MKAVVTVILTSALTACAEPGDSTLLVRQIQEGTGIVWDMPLTAGACTIPTSNHDNSLLQWWGVDGATARIRLQDQKLIGPYLPAAEIKVTTFDSYPRLHRSRVDQPFVVEITLSGLLGGLDLPLSAANVLLERHLQSYQNGITKLDAAQVVSNEPLSCAYLSDNGKIVLRFEASALTAADPTKAAGEEHFVVRALAESNAISTQIASGFVQVWPVASGSIQGIARGEVFTSHLPQIVLQLDDLYPRSDIYLMLFEGTQLAGVDGDVITAFSIDSEVSESRVVRVSGLDFDISADGVFSLALMADTVFGRELLDSVTFVVERGGMKRVGNEGRH